MGSGASNTPTTSGYDVDPAKLAEFMRSQTGSQFKDVYDPTRSYYQYGDKYFSYGKSPVPGAVGGPDTTRGPAVVPGGKNQTDVTGFMKAYQTWLAGDQQAQLTWENYSKAVASNNGGEGDNTITTGAAVGQRQQLLGALANPTAPTPGFGTMGTTAKKLGAL